MYFCKTWLDIVSHDFNLTYYSSIILASYYSQNYAGILAPPLATSVYEFDNMVRGQHVYKSAWTSLTDKTSKCILREDNKP